METLYPDQVWNYKNFNMVAELDIAGEFIYDGISALYQMKTITEQAGLFSFFYHTAVGIERLQKIIIVLFEYIDIEKHTEFEEQLKTHSHITLNQWICKLCSHELNSRENQFLQTLADFYKHARYGRFNLDSQFSREREIFSRYLIKHMNDAVEYHPFDEKVMLITPRIKELLGRTIGSLAKKYYSLVRKGCEKSNTFTYEVRAYSKAEKVFCNTYKKNSLQKQKATERIAFKELLIYLRNTKDKHGLIHYIDNIKPLEFDPVLVNEYIGEISGSTIPQELVDEVETIYENNSYCQERIDEVDVIGDQSVDFNYYPIHRCYLLMDELITKKVDGLNFATSFLTMYEMVDPDYECDILCSVSSLCERVINGEISSDELLDEIWLPYTNLKRRYESDD